MTITICLFAVLSCFTDIPPKHPHTPNIPHLIKQLSSSGGAEVHTVIKQLKGLPITDFTEQDRLQIANRLKPDQYHLQGVIELAGFLQLRDSLDGMDPKHLSTESLKNAHALALVRSGDQKLRETMLSNIMKMAVDDAYVHQVAPMLIYTRQRDCIDHVLLQILSDQPSCSPSDPETNGQIVCGYRLMELVAPVLQDFPYSVSKSGSLKVENYREALLAVRKWIKTNQSSYRIDATSY